MLVCRLLPAACAVTSNTGAVVTCVRTNPATGFPAAFALTLTASSGSGLCGTNVSRTVVVNSTCCVRTAAFARDSNRSQCLSTLGCPAGFINNFTTMANTRYPLTYGNCTRFAPTGTVDVSCAAASAGSTNSVVTIGLAVQTVTGGTAATNFYAGCALPTGTNRCATSNWGATTCTGTTAVGSCGGSLTATRTVTLLCRCEAVRWIVASVPSAAATLTAARVNGECLP